MNAIAIVDDNELDLTLAQAAFARSGVRWELLALLGPEGFFELADAVRLGGPAPRVVLLDVNMPGRSGFEVLEATYREPCWTHDTRFIMFSNSEDPRHRKRAEDFGVDYRVKPLEFTDYVRFFASLAA